MTQLTKSRGADVRECLCDGMDSACLRKQEAEEDNAMTRQSSQIADLSVKSTHWSSFTP